MLAATGEEVKKRESVVEVPCLIGDVGPKDFLLFAGLRMFR
jgi:hypothetical protein